MKMFELQCSRIKFHEPSQELFFAKALHLGTQFPSYVIWPKLLQNKLKVRLNIVFLITDQGIDEANLPAEQVNQNNAAGEEATNPNDAWTTVNEDQVENEVIEDQGDKINADENQDWNQYPTIDEIDQGRNLDNAILEAATASQINFVDEPILSESKINEDSNMNTLIQDETQIEDTKTIAAATETASVQGVKLHQCFLKQYEAFR